MLSFILRRLLQTVLIMLGVLTVVFVLVRLTGDPAALYLPEDASQEQIEALQTRLGLDQPVHVQYFGYVGDMMRGDLGTSLWHNRPVADLLISRLPATAVLTGVSMLFAVAIALPLGVLSAIKRNSLTDSLGRVVALLGLSLPNFWVGIMLILIFSVQLNWLPSFGRGSWQHLILPAIALGTSAAGTIMRLVRSTVLETMNEDFVRTARAKGLPERVVVGKHVLRNAAIPTVTFIGMQIGFFLSGAVVVETVFGYPGIGRLAIQAIANRDFAIVQAFVLFSAVVFALVNFLVDYLYTTLDPRIRL